MLNFYLDYKLLALVVWFGWMSKRNLNFIDSLAKWNVENVEDMSYMFYECRLLQKIDGLETWFPKNIINYNYFKAGCNMLNNVPDLSLWKKSDK